MKATAGMIEWLNMVRRIAYYQVRLALESGELVKPEFCSRCGKHSEFVDAHHADYAEPLNVEWLCVSCHKKEHSRIMQIYRQTWTELSDIFYEYGTLKPTQEQMVFKYKQAIELEKKNARWPASASI
jgi:ribosomal protein S27AE